MRPEQILANQARILTQEQREFYFENGYLVVDSIVPTSVIEQARAVTDEMVQRSGNIIKSDAIFDVEPGHSPNSPRLRRLTSPVEHHSFYWDFANGLIADVAADLVGPDVKFHHSKLNFKWSDGGEEVKWHQVIQYWPHTNYSPLTIGTYLYDVGPEQGPLGVIPKSHLGPLYNQYDDKGQWVGCLSSADADTLKAETTQYLTGRAGSITVHNCRAVHGSSANLSVLGRPLLLNVYSSADAFTYTANPLPSQYEGVIVRGKPALWADHDPRPCLIPPDWSDGYTSLFALQQEEKWDSDQLEAVTRQHYEMSNQDDNDQAR